MQLHTTATTNYCKGEKVAETYKMIRTVQTYFFRCAHTDTTVYLAKMSIKMLYLLLRGLDVLSTSLYNDKETCT